MIYNYLKIAWRSLMKNRLFTALNMVGLSTGLCVALLLMLYVKDERSFDKYNIHSGDIFRVNVTATFDGKSKQWANSPNVVGPTLKTDIPDVLEQTRILSHDYGKTAFINVEDRKFSEKKLFWVDNSLFRIFDVPFIEGNPSKALDRPNTVVLSETLAHKYFGKENPLGKTIKIDNHYQLEVTGVYRDFPGNSTLDASLMGSFKSIEWANKNLVWSNASFETYILLQPGADALHINKQMQQVLDKNVDKADQWFSLWLQPLTDVHLGSSEITNASTTRVGDAKQVKILTILAIVVLLIASINYMNLSTARAQLRFKEVSITKTVGANFLQLAGRFYLETSLLTLMSVILAICLVIGGIPLLNSIAQKSLSASSLFSVEVMTGIGIVALLIIIIAGSYPAFYLSSFRPKELLHTTFRMNTGTGLFRRALVVIQFIASVVLIVGTIIFYKQLQFIQHKNLGYQPEQVVAVTTAAAENTTEIDALINGCRQLSNVVQVCRAQTWPGYGGSGRTLSRADDLKQGTFIRTNRVTNEFAEVLGVKWLAGKTFRSEKPKEDTTVQVVINKTACDFLGFKPGEAIGKTAYNLFDVNRAEIVGVVEDFNFESLHQPISAYAFHNNDSEWRPYLLVKLKTANLAGSMSQLENVFKKSVPNSAFEYTFLDQFLNTLYQAEQRTAKVVLLFASLAIVIACLGLFGLAAFTAEQRTREIGVRKVLGAGISGIAILLSRDFLKLVLIAVVIAIPLAWYGMNQWLQDFAYRIKMGWLDFYNGGSLALLVALVTVSFQAIKAAMANPVKSLRAE